MPSYTLKGPKPRRKGYPEEPKTLGEHLKRRRLELGLRQEDVAVQIGVRAETICAWELGRKQAPVRLIPRIYGFVGFCSYDPSWTLGERLGAAREAQGLSRKWLADATGLDAATIGRIEKGLPGLERRCVAVLAAALASPVAPVQGNICAP